MATISNSYVQRTIGDEINAIFAEFLEFSRKFILKNHKFLGYF